MILLDRNTKTIEALLGEAISANNLPVVVSYQDTMSPPQGPASDDYQTNGVTPVTVSGEWLIDYSQRRILELSINNIDAIPHDVIIQLNNGTTTRIIKKINLSVGDSLHYENERGWYVLDKYGAPKTNPGSNTDDMIYIVATGPDNYVASTPKITTYFEGLAVSVKFVGNNTGAVTLNINSLGALQVKNFVGHDLEADEIESGGIYDLQHDGAIFQLKSVTDKIVNSP